MIARSVTGEIALLWEDADPYQGRVILMTLDGDEPMRLETFEIRGEVAGRFASGALAEGMRVRVECRSETVETVDPDTGETADGARPVVLDVVVLGP